MTPTILIFLKAPVAGQVKTRLAHDIGSTNALEIYERLVHRQMAALPDDWPVEIHFAPIGEEELMRAWLGERDNWSFWPQVETDLGQRLAHATRGAFERGAEAVMLIGGDCPELGEAEFHLAAERLNKVEVVVGPSLDGGYYLLGTRQPNLQLFENVAWSTATVAERTRAIIAEQGWSSAEISQLRDVDTVTDWDTLKHLL